MFTLKPAIALILALIAQQAADQKEYQPLGEITGTDSAVERPMVVVAQDRAEFDQLWRTHKEIFSDPPTLGGTTVVEAQIPVVDFKKNIVIAYFAGQTQGIAGFEIAGVDAKGKTIQLRIAPVNLSTAVGITANSFGMWVFPKNKKPIEFELVVGLRNGKPVVRQLARIEPTKEPASRTKPPGNPG